MTGSARVLFAERTGEIQYEARLSSSCGASLISEVDTGGNRGERELDLLPDRVYDLWFMVVVAVYF